ncbi:uroporphyrinogen-III C-methyltransferase [Rhodopseudomonas faecalis]|uniref:Uroporphyrinogen-III C-methyltransferase n=1 Tax=Rhodopseudomonas faecalis TaxID=99655 RepID=A0A318TSK2_9BRAD|nr:siroheme synthase CysG [Rhodopseudomonas faecalis]PYF02619.1 uroporphyrinogen-III C-methyltransferase [Rhodopseudomonas faecalis]
MRFLPVFLDLRAGWILVVGGGEPVRAKLRLLLAAGAKVRWYATDGDRDLGGVGLGDGRIDHLEGDPLTLPLDGVIAVFCAGAGAIGSAVAARAQARGLPVNVMDDLTDSSFIMPAIVDRGDVVVAIGTGGASPVLARRLREQIEALLPARIGELSAFIGRWRKSIAARIPEFALRRRFWERVVDGPIGAALLAGRSDDAERALAEISNPSAFAAAKGAGQVTLVGAGPGDPELLTLKALRALQDADVIFHDELVSPEILDRARRDAVRVPVGRRIGQPGIGQPAIHDKMIEAARAGQNCVRLKGGDPFVFGRGGEEIEALRAAGIAYQVIPGISAAFAAASEFDLPLTYRHEARHISVLTAHQAADTEAIDWAALRDPQITVVIYMGMAAAVRIRDGLLRAGRAPDTPAGVFARVARADAQAAVGTLEQLPELVAQIGEGPALLIIGAVVARSAPWRQQAPTALTPSHWLAAAE